MSKSFRVRTDVRRGGAKDKNVTDSYFLCYDKKKNKYMIIHLKYNAFAWIGW